MSAQVYSERLGRIDDTQLEAAATRLNLGRLRHAAPARGGLFGQNLYLTTTEGEFVLRGAPHWFNGKRLDQWQFRKEKFFAELLHAQTRAPVPWPMLYDDGDDIFGWPYLVMPRLKGTALDTEALKALPHDDLQSIAGALGETLAELQQLRSQAAGDVDETFEFSAFPGGYLAYLADQVRISAAGAEKSGTFDARDRAFVESVMNSALSGDTNQPVTYTHGDYSVGNVLFENNKGQWQVSGVFDLHTSCFGNTIYDLCRQACVFAMVDRDVIPVFIDNWKSAVSPPPIEPAIFRLCLCNERILLWDYFSRPENAAEWTRQSSFRAFLKSYERQVLAALA